MWCVRIRLRVAREETDGAGLSGGRVLERRWGLLGFFFFVAINDGLGGSAKELSVGREAQLHTRSVVPEGWCQKSMLERAIK